MGPVLVQADHCRRAGQEPPGRAGTFSQGEPPCLETACSAELTGERNGDSSVLGLVPDMEQRRQEAGPGCSLLRPHGAMSAPLP